MAASSATETAAAAAVRFDTLLNLSIKFHSISFAVYICLHKLQ